MTGHLPHSRRVSRAVAISRVDAERSARMTRALFLGLLAVAVATEAMLVLQTLVSG